MKKRGFGLLTRARNREVSSLGGKAVPSDKRAFSQDRKLAAEAGRKGGRRRWKKVAKGKSPVVESPSDGRRDPVGQQETTRDS